MTERQTLSTCHRLLGQDDSEYALGLLRKATELHPNSSELRGLRRKVERSLAQPLIQQALALHEQGPSAATCLHLVELYTRIGEVKEAIEYGNHAIQLEPDSALGYRMVTELHLQDFKATGDSIAGMNALRYAVKAHNLAPRDSRVLLDLTEIFLLLRAPLAARRFLNPVLQAFPDEARVRELSDRVSQLPPENTTQIQELFLTYEREVLGAARDEHPEVSLDREVIQDVVSAAARLTSLLGFYLIDGHRQVIAGFNHGQWSESELGNCFGLLVDVAAQNSERMDLGTFESITVKQDNVNLVVASLGSGLSAFIFGSPETKNEEMENILHDIHERLRLSPVGGGR
ncbi:MAG: tetratricopeptide repeat protein [Planctomycetota bacterium]